jgi:hypothetical protein
VASLTTCAHATSSVKSVRTRRHPKSGGNETTERP